MSKKLTQKIKTQINKVVCNMPTYQNEIPLDAIEAELKKHGLILIQEDRTEWSGFLCGGVKETVQVSFDLGNIDKFEEVHGLKLYEVVRNAGLHLSYFVMPSGRYEIVCYVS